ncbi:MAG TPA: tetratricopeptide repeat protein, partial [Pyrinomonadaceae bacterium]|nr:tetratricopeptide repeat protein [Pyrinomonadaceae bacterium]
MKFPILAAILIAACVSACLGQTTDASPEFSSGVQLYQAHNYHDAVKQLKKAVKKSKDNADAWYYLGLALLKDPKSLKDGSKALETANALHLNWAPGLTAFAYALLLRNNLEDAKRKAEEALRLDDKNVEALYVVGVVHVRKGERDAGLKAAQAAIDLDPQFAPAHLLKSQALVTFSRDVLIADPAASPDDRKAVWAEAAESLETYLRLAPNTVDKEAWQSQLEGLRFFSRRSTPGDPEFVYSGKDVTTKARVLAKPEPSYTEPARSNGI